MKESAARHRELFAAIGALPADRRLGERIDLGSAAMRAEGLAIVHREPDTLEGVESLGIRQPDNLRDAQAPCGRADEKMLWQGA
jgi:hypothetical protein